MFLPVLEEADYAAKVALGVVGSLPCDLSRGFSNPLMAVLSYEPKEIGNDIGVSFLVHEPR